jgi:hypothetical protein
MLTGNNRERATPTPTGPLGGFTAAQPPLGRPLHPPPPSTFSQSLIRFYASIDFGVMSTLLLKSRRVTAVSR